MHSVSALVVREIERQSIGTFRSRGDPVETAVFSILVTIHVQSGAVRISNLDFAELPAPVVVEEKGLVGPTVELVRFSGGIDRSQPTIIRDILDDLTDPPTPVGFKTDLSFLLIVSIRAIPPAAPRTAD